MYATQLWMMIVVRAAAWIASAIAAKNYPDPKEVNELYKWIMSGGINDEQEG